MIFLDLLASDLVIYNCLKQFQLSSFTKNYITMDAIKKKMQAMKLEKDNAMDRADACEQQAKDANLRAERVSDAKYFLQSQIFL